MARTLYAGRTGDTVLSRMLMGDGRIVVGVPASAGGTPAATTLTVWDEPDGIMLTDLLAADGVTPITELVVPAGEIQIPAFYGPDGVTGDLWLKDPDGDYSRLDIGPQGPAGPPGADGTGTVNSVNGVAPVAGNVLLGASDVGAQPSDSDLTAIAALTTTAYGRAFLVLANQAALMALLSSSSTTAQGIIELATNTEATTGTDTARAVTPAGGRAHGDARYAQNTGGGREKSAALSATTGTCTGDLSAASVFTITPTGNWTLAFSNVPASGTSCLATVIVTEGATPRTMTQPTGTKFMGAAAPTAVASKARIYNYETVDGGTTWYASAAVEQ